MKKLLYIVLAAALFVPTSCDYDLDHPTSLTPDLAIEDAEGLRMALYGVYEMMSLNRGSHASDLTFYADCKGGDVAPNNDAGHITPLQRFEASVNHSLYYNIFYAIYEPIAYASMAMEAAERLGFDDDPEIERLHAQLKAARAFLHFEAARIFAQLPTVSGVNMDAEDSGIIVVDKVYPIQHKFSRSTLQESYDFIVEQLLEAIPLLPNEHKNGELNSWGAKAILSRVYLYLGNNSQAYSTATDVIENGPYDLLTHANYLAAWSKVGADEFIFEILTSDSNYNQPQRNSIGYYTNPSGYGEVGARDNFVSVIQALNANDIRRETVTYRTGNYPGNYTTKYMGQEGASIPLYVNNPKIIRLAEVYLIAAEAAVKGGSTPANADKYYNEYKSSRYSSGYTNVSGVTLTNILDERRVELFCENHRMFDLVRNNLSVQKYEGGNETVSPTDYRVVAPIPQKEMDINSPVLKQNPGYAGYN